jgi:hypothetical protein
MAGDTGWRFAQPVVAHGLDADRGGRGCEHRHCARRAGDLQRGRAVIEEVLDDLLVQRAVVPDQVRGVSSLDDLRAIAGLTEIGLEGVIVGKRTRACSRCPKPSRWWRSEQLG